MEQPFQKSSYNTIKEFIFNYPDGDNTSSWMLILEKWIKKNRDNLYTRTRTIISIAYVLKIIRTFNTVLLNDLLYNHTIFAFPGNKVFMFIAQVPENSKNKKLYYKTGMYSIRLYLHYISTTRKRAVYKYIYFLGKYKIDVLSAMVKGHKYPRKEDVIDYINTQYYG